MTPQKIKDFLTELFSNGDVYLIFTDKGVTTFSLTRTSLKGEDMSALIKFFGTANMDIHVDQVDEDQVDLDFEIHHVTGFCKDE